MTTAREDYTSVATGYSCPVCGSAELRWGAPLGALWHGQCRDCGVVYTMSEYDQPTPLCEDCGQTNHWDYGSPFCEDCRLSDCVWCGVPTHAYLLSENLACRFCEEDVA
jgi:hypothetical protein